jgi:hypothetical protein
VLLVFFCSYIPIPYRLAQNIDTNAKYKAMFIYNFTKYFEWPQSYKEGNFVIGVLGNSSLLAELNTMASSKKAGNQSIEIKTFSNVGAITNCHMLIVAPEVTTPLSEIISKIKKNSTLLITEKQGFAKQGAAINFVVQNNKPAFELNKTNAEKQDLKVSTNLLSLAILVE